MYIKRWFYGNFKKSSKNVCEISKDTPESVHYLWKTQTLHEKVCNNDVKLPRKLT